MNRSSRLVKSRNLIANKRTLFCEQLEARIALSGMVSVTEPSVVEPSSDTFYPMIVAGASPDSPAARVDSNLDKSPFDGVGSITITTRRGGYICTGTPIDDTHIVTASHCLDINGDGKSNSKDGITRVTFNLNYGGTYTSQISASSWVTHPDYTGFNRPSTNDDIAVLTLSRAIPADVPRYRLFTGDLTGQTINMVGYGQSGDGINGYTVSASYTVKRMGANVVDAFYGQDDSGRAAANEVFRFDFDRDDGSNGPLGGQSLGNAIETTLGGGDSGGPSFVLVGTEYQLAGVNTFSQGTATVSAPKFGSMGGGMSIPAYASWINQVVTGAVVAMSDTTPNGPTANGSSLLEEIMVSEMNQSMDRSLTLALTFAARPELDRVSEVRASGQPINITTNFATKLATDNLVITSRDSSSRDAASQTASGEQSATRRRLRVQAEQQELPTAVEIAAIDAYHQAN